MAHGAWRTAGLKFGIYTDRGTATCVGRPGSQGYEKNDADTYAKWGVDLVKEDSCNAPSDHNTSFEQYGLMRDALNATGRPIYFALCGWSSWYVMTYVPGTRTHARTHQMMGARTTARQCAYTRVCIMLVACVCICWFGGWFCLPEASCYALPPHTCGAD